MRRVFEFPNWFVLLLAAVVVSLCLVTAGNLLGAEQFVEDTAVADENGAGVTLDGNRPAADANDHDASSSTQTRVPRPRKNRFSTPDPALELTDPRTYRLKWVIKIDAPDAPAKGIVATGPIPMEWPEQHVRLLREKRSPHSRVSEQVFNGQAAVLKFQVSQIPKGGTAFIERLYEITRYRTKFTLPGEDMQWPRAMPPELRDQVKGTPPGIELNNPKMVELAEMLRHTGEPAGPWETVKGFWSWTRDNVKFENGDFRGAMHAIEQHCGDCEEMSALFVGMCRLSGIPARTVWVESHDYPEFYLLDQQGKGHWIPAQVLGPPWFGEMAEYRPIFQKGDRFYDPLQRTYVRYVPQTVRGAHAKVAPKVQFTHEIISDSDINGPSYNSSGSGDRSTAK